MLTGVLTRYGHRALKITENTLLVSIRNCTFILNWSTIKLACSAGALCLWSFCLYNDSEWPPTVWFVSYYLVGKYYRRVISSDSFTLGSRLLHCICWPKLGLCLRGNPAIANNRCSHHGIHIMECYHGQKLCVWVRDRSSRLLMESAPKSTRSSFGFLHCPEIVRNWGMFRWCQTLGRSSPLMNGSFRVGPRAGDYCLEAKGQRMIWGNQVGYGVRRGPRKEGNSSK